MRRVKPQGGWARHGMLGGSARAASLWAGRARGCMMRHIDHCATPPAEHPAILAGLLLPLQVITEPSHTLHATTAAAPNAAAPAALAAGVGAALGLAGQDMQLLVAEV